MKQIFTERLRGDRALQMHLRKGFALDPSCKLWLPFCKYGSEQAKIYDQSGNNNHGTIVGAVPYPGNPQMTSVGSTFNRGDFTATNAFFWSSLNLSAFAGTDLGYTPFYIEALDAAGKKATGYLGAVGAGETLGSELVTEWTNASAPNAYDTFTTSGKDITSAINSLGVAGEWAWSNSTGILLQKLYKLVFVYSYTAGTNYIVIGTGGENLSIREMAPGGTHTIYLTCVAEGTTKDKIQAYNNSSLTSFSSTYTLKEITDPPSTAVHIVSSLNGTVRNWASIASGFNPNTITSWKIDSVIPKTAIGWYFDDVDDRIVHTSINFGKTHTLLYWLQSFANAKDIIHGGAANNHVAIDGTNIYYNAGATELSQAHGGGMGNSTMVGIVRSGTTVQFFKNGIQVGTDQTLNANNDLTLTTLGSYDTPGSFLGGVILHTIGFNRALSAQEIRDYYELTRSRYGV